MKNKLRMILVLCVILISSITHAQQPPLMLKKCQACHGKQLNGKKKNPSIVDLSYEKLYASLTTNIPKKMKRVVNKLTDEQKAELSKYIFSLGYRTER